METERQRYWLRPVAALGLLLALFLVVVAGAIGTATYSLPGCSSCHFKESGFEAATVQTVHSQVECTSCHVRTDSLVPRTKFGLYEALGMWVPVLDPASSDVTEVSDDRCLSCHTSVMQDTIKVRGLSIRHKECAVGRSCVDCHSEVGHGEATTWARVVSMNDCVTCHKQTRSSIECETCHDGKIEAVAYGKAEFAVTHGANWRKTHGMGQMSVCSVCHQESSCSRCHGPGVPHGTKFLEEHAQLSKRSDAKCTGCHQKAFCSDCHGMEMPHPKEFASRHSSLVERDGDQACKRCHDDTDCETCHVKHVHPGGSVGPVPKPARRDR